MYHETRKFGVIAQPVLWSAAKPVVVAYPPFAPRSRKHARPSIRCFFRSISALQS